MNLSLFCSYPDYIMSSALLQVAFAGYVWYDEYMNKTDITLILGIMLINAITVLSLSMILV